MYSWKIFASIGIELDILTKRVEMILTQVDQKRVEPARQIKSHGSRKQNRLISKAGRHGAATNLPDSDTFCNIPIETITDLIGMR